MDDVALTKLVCTILGEIPGWAWRETGPAYTPAEVGVHYGRIPPDQSTAVGVRAYGGTDDLVTGHAIRRVQVFTRGAPHTPDSADTLAGAVFTHLQRISRVGGINSARRSSWSPLGADANGREERSDNYEITLDNLEAF